MSIDEWDSAQVYLQVAAIIRDRIARNEYRPGQRLPGERAMEQEFGVSQGSVRRALKILREEGAIVTYHGRGTFVPPEGWDATP